MESVMFFFCKQKTAYEMRISDWSSDVCSSDLHRLHREWSTSGTACPGDARVHQFKTVVLPGIVARAAGPTTSPPTSTETDMDLQDKILLGDWVDRKSVV